jgi:hypothetical protein
MLHIVITGKIFSCDIKLPENNVNKYLKSVMKFVKSKYTFLEASEVYTKKFKKEYATKVKLQKV